MACVHHTWELRLAVLCLPTFRVLSCSYTHRPCYAYTKGLAIYDMSSEQFHFGHFSTIPTLPTPNNIIEWYLLISIPLIVFFTCHPYQWNLITENTESAELLLKVSPCLEASSPLEDVKQCNTSLYFCTVSLHTLSLEGTNVRFECSLQLC